MNTPVVSPSVQAGGSSPAGLRAGGLFFGWVIVDARLIRDSGRRRATLGGDMAVVWEAV